MIKETAVRNIHVAFGYPTIWHPTMQNIQLSQPLLQTLRVFMQMSCLLPFIVHLVTICCFKQQCKQNCLRKYYGNFDRFINGMME